MGTVMGLRTRVKGPDRETGKVTTTNSGFVSSLSELVKRVGSETNLSEATVVPGLPLSDFSLFGVKTGPKVVRRRCPTINKNRPNIGLPRSPDASVLPLT